MLETYRTGGDIHAQTTSVIYGIPFEVAVDKSAEGYKERRTIAKNCNFGVFFGLFANGPAAYAQVQSWAGYDES